MGRPRRVRRGRDRAIRSARGRRAQRDRALRGHRHPLRPWSQRRRRSHRAHGNAALRRHPTHRDGDIALGGHWATLRWRDWHRLRGPALLLSRPRRRLHGLWIRSLRSLRSPTRRWLPAWRRRSPRDGPRRRPVRPPRRPRIRAGARRIPIRWLDLEAVERLVDLGIECPELGIERRLARRWLRRRCSRLRRGRGCRNRGVRCRRDEEHGALPSVGLLVLFVEDARGPVVGSRRSPGPPALRSH